MYVHEGYVTITKGKSESMCKSILSMCAVENVLMKKEKKADELPRLESKQWKLNAKSQLNSKHIKRRLQNHHWHESGDYRPGPIDRRWNKKQKKLEDEIAKKKDLLQDWNELLARKRATVASGGFQWMINCSGPSSHQMLSKNKTVSCSWSYVSQICVCWER